MLQIITGAKTADIKGCMLSYIEQVGYEKRVLIITPEQFSFELEREIYHKISVKRQQNLIVTGFTRLSHMIFKEYGGVCSEAVDDVAKLITMRQAIKLVADRLVVYNKNTDKISFISKMLDEITQLCDNGVTAIELEQAQRILDTGLLKDKMNDLALIYSAYQMKLLESYEEPEDTLTKAATKLKNKSFFKDTVVFLFGFDGFTYPQFNLIKHIIEEKSNLYVTLCYDKKSSGDNGDSDFFAGVKKTYDKLIFTTKECSAEVKIPIHYEEQVQGLSSEIAHIERNIFRNTQRKFEGENSAVKVMMCKNEYDEVNFVASSIFELVYQGEYRFKDIVVCTRDYDVYAQKLQKAMEKYNVPYYMDNNEKLTDKLIVRFINIIFDIVNSSFSPSFILMLLKTGLLKYSVEEVGEFENYLFVWDIKGSDIKKPFTQNPAGMKPFDEKSTATLSRIEKIRQEVITPLQEFDSICKSATGRDISRCIYNILIGFGVDKANSEIANDYAKIEDFYNANLTVRVWNLCMEVLDKLAVGIDQVVVTAQEYSQFFDMVIQSFDFGVIEQTLDCVSVTQVQRMRLDNTKVVIILGVNEGIFPYVEKQTGLFTDSEKQKLMELDISIKNTEIDLILKERYFAYQALTSPTEKLLVTSRKLDLSGNVKRKSVVVTQLTSMFGDGVVSDTEDISKLLYCKTLGSSFEYLAKTYNDKTIENASIIEALSQNELYKTKLLHIEYAKQTRSVTLQNKDKAKALYGNNLKVSPSRVESYYRCPFLYFCQFGLKITPLMKAKYNPILRGELVHTIVEQVYNEIKEVSSFEGELVNRKINIYFDNYIETILQNEGDSSAQSRVVHTLGRFKRAIFDVVKSIYEEQVQSEFKLSDTEYDIGGGVNSEVSPLYIPLDSGGSIEIYGRIDRIDTYVNEANEKYVRVIDYKTGGKKFKLSDILNGMNMQMLIYLFSIVKNGKGKYANCKPAGVLYFPAKAVRPEKTIKSDREYESRRIQSHQMNGIVVADRNGDKIDLSIVRAMEKDISSKFIPIKLKKDAKVIVSDVSESGLYKEASEVLQTTKQFNQIYKYLSKKIKHMGEGIHHGDISESRIKDICQYCNYGRICTVDQRDSLLSFSQIELDEIYQDE